MLQLERKLDSNFIKHSMLKWYGATAVQAVLSIFFLVVSISAYLKKLLPKLMFCLSFIPTWNQSFAGQHALSGKIE